MDVTDFELLLAGVRLLGDALLEDTVASAHLEFVTETSIHGLTEVILGGAIAATFQNSIFPDFA